MSSNSNKKMTMADLMAHGKSTVKSFRLGDKVEGIVVDILPKSLILNIGGKSEGVVAEKAFQEAREYIKTLKVGDKVKGEVIVSETRQGNTIISLRSSAKDNKWKEIEEAYEKGNEVTVEILSVSPAGASVQVLGLNGFLPSSQMGKELSEDTDSIVNKKIQVKIVELDKKMDKVVVSEKAVSEKEEMANQAKSYVKVKENEVYTGIITKLTNFGAFVSFSPDAKEKTQIEGLIHISEISWSKVKSAKDALEVGQEVKFKVLSKETDRNGKAKMSLSIKQALDDPWNTITEKYQVEQTVTGRVTKQTDYGYFIELEPGIEGLLHITKVPHDKTINQGEEIKCFIEEINAKDRKISLGVALTAKPLLYK